MDELWLEWLIFNIVKDWEHAMAVRRLMTL
jgi:hypothetical protein